LPDLDIDENSVMVLKNVGPKGYPGMAEVGNMGIPKKLLEKGVKDMVRISDGRMSGTGFGTVILHVSPESAAGGPLNWVENGDFIENHNDGGYDLNRGRLCVILIYLSDEKDHKADGGKFILRDDKLHEEIPPFKGNFVMLDFTKHNLFHEVEKVKNNFRRFCYISFVSNKEKKNE
jgi:hypothetical protein